MKVTKINIKLFLKCLLGIALINGFIILLIDPAARVERKYPDREKVVFWHMWTGEWKKVIDRIVDEFNENQNKYEVSSLSLANGDMKFLLSTAGGDPPDVMAQWNCVIPAWAKRKALMPLDSLMSDEDKKAFEETYPVIQKICHFEDQNYGICVGLNMNALFYRPSHFEEVGLDPNKPPKTISELNEMSEKLYKVAPDGKIQRVGIYPNFIQQWIPSFGPGMYDYDSKQMTIVTPNNLRCLEWMQSFPKKYGVKNLTFFESSFQNGYSGTLDWPFITGGYSFMVDGQWRIEQLAKYAPDLDYRICPLPAADEDGRPNACLCNGNFLLIPSSAKCPEGAWAFMRYWSGIANPDNAAKYYTWGGWMPISPAVTNAAVFQEYLTKYPQWKTFVDLLPSENLQVWPPVVYQNFLLDRIATFSSVLTSMSKSPKETLEGLRDMVTQEEERIKRGQP